MKRVNAFVATALLSVGVVSYANAAEQHKNFLTCPIVRDTEMVPCWLAEFEGEMYFLGLQQDLQDPFFPPQLKHKALIEGTVSNKPRVCGGIPLENLKVSVIKEIDLNCVTILPAEGFEIKNARRGVGPDFETLSQTNQARDRAGEKLDPPYKVRKYTYYYDFDDSYMPSRSVRILQNAMRFAKLSNAAKVEVISTRGAAKLTSQPKLLERASLAQTRAAEAAYGLAHIGVPKAIITSRTVDETGKVTGVDDWKSRRTTIIVTPGKADSVTAN